jgi:hypothetical protein
MNTNLLKEAIAEADAIKKMAIENAKASLNEAFDSKVKAMLAARLSEESDELEEEYEESDDNDKMKEEKQDKEEGGDEGYGMEEAEDEVYSEEDEVYSEEDENYEEAFNLDEIIAELEKGEKGEEGDVRKGEDEDDEDDEKPKKKKPEMDEANDNEEDKENSVDEEIDIAKLLAEMEDGGDNEGYNMEEEAGDDEVVKEDASTMMDILQGLAGGAALGAASAGVVKLSDYLEQKHPDIFKKIQSIAQSAAKAKGLEEKKEEGMVDKKKDSEELQEIKRQAAVLAQKVNETNLINAKLLYLNKILRKYNLSEQQKLKVISAFDKAGTTREAKIVHESLDQAFSVKNDNTKVGLKESMGFASKAAGTSTKRVINEGVITDADAQVSRWQKLAGIIK